MKKLHTVLAIASVGLLSACGSTPERTGTSSTSDAEVTRDTAPGINDNNVEILAAGTNGQTQGQNIGSGQDIDNMKMVDVDSFYEPVIYFGYDQSELDEKATNNIRYHAEIVLSNPSQNVVLYGHTDERGTPEYNLALGEKRAKAVEQAMMLFGVNQSRIDVVSYGEEQPQDANSNEAAWQKNRRVEIVIK